MADDKHLLATSVKDQLSAASTPDMAISPSTTAAKGIVDLGQLTDQQRYLYHALLEKDSALRDKNSQMAQMYFGAILVLRQAGNPDHLALAAHGLRELMEKMPRYLNVPVAQGAGMTDRVTVLVTRLRAVGRHEEGTTSHSSRVTEFLAASEDFAAWFEGQHSSRKERAGHLLDRLDQRKAKLPGPIKDAHTSVWNTCHKFFEDVSHHRIQSSADEFGGYVDVLELFLLDRLKPRTFEDQSVLKSIIEEGEHSA